MNLPRSFSDSGIILKRHNYGEADRILTIFTFRFGKLSAIAKGIRKTSSKKSPHLEPFVLTQLEFARGKNLHLITSADTQHSFKHIRNNLISTRLAFYLCEVTDRLTADNDPQPEVFNQLAQTLTFLDSQNQLAQIKQHQAINIFQLKLLTQLGFGHPPKKDLLSIIGFIEDIANHRINSKSDIL